MARAKNLRLQSIQALVEEVLRKGLIRPAQLAPLLARHEEADATARAAEAKRLLSTALARFTDPALIGPWCDSMARRMQAEIQADWHDGYEDQSALFGELMVDFDTMIAVASMAACQLQEFNRALAACKAIGSGLTKFCKTYSHSRNPVEEEVHNGPAVERFVFPMEPPAVPLHIPAAVEEPSRVQKLITPLIDSWELEDEEEWPGAERVCGPHTALARIWLTAVVGRLEASGCSSKAQGEASKWLCSLHSFMDSNQDWVRPFRQYVVDPNPLLTLADEMALRKKPAVWKVVEAAVAAHKAAKQQPQGARMGRGR